MNNTTAMNETTANSTMSWENIKDLSIFQETLSSIQSKFSELLISWDFGPEDVYFKMVLLLLIVVIGCVVIIKGSNLMSRGIKIIFVIVSFVGLLMLFKII